MADPSVFPFIDQLMTKIRALPSCAEPVAVFDGAPSSEQADTIVAIGASQSGVLYQGKQTFAQLGFMAMWEEYYVDGLISAVAAGDSGVGDTIDPSANAQRQSRNTACTIFNAIFEALRADPNFATANGGTPLVLYCRIENVEIRQIPNERGRQTVISFRIYVKNRIATS